MIPVTIDDIQHSRTLVSMMLAKLGDREIHGTPASTDIRAKAIELGTPVGPSFLYDVDVEFVVINGAFFWFNP